MAEAPTPVAPPRAAGRSVASLAPDLAVGVVLLTWATWLTWGTGGREPYRLSVFAVTVLVAHLAVRPWQVLPRLGLVLGNALGLAAVVVLLTAPTGWAGRDDAASYAVVGQLVLVLAAWAVDEARRWALLLSLMAFGALQFVKGWLQWWGGEDPTVPFQGTFYWHNQSGISLALAAVLAGLVVVSGRRPWVLAAWFVAPVCAAGTLYSTSRASQLLLVLGLLVLAGWAVAARQVRAWWPRLAALSLLSWGTSVLLAGPPYFTSSSSPFAGTAARGAEEPLSGNTSYRLETWGNAVSVWREWPLTGAGFDSFKSAASQVTGEPQIVHHSHNGFLQAAADGGLVLALPLWVGAIGLAVVVVRRVLRDGRLLGLDALGGAVALLLLVLHSGMDFDWSYPALFVAGGVAAAAAWQPLPVPGTGRARTVAAVCGALLILFAVVAAWGGGLDLNAPVGGSS